MTEEAFGCRSVDRLVTPYVDRELASAEREQANSNICVSIQIYDQTITRYAASPRAQPDQDVIDGLSKLSEADLRAELHRRGLR